MPVNALLTYAAAFAAAFVYVGLKAAQQLNVVHSKYVWIMPVSLGMAATEVLIIEKSAHYGWGWIVLAIGTGSGLGAMLAMWLHGKYVRPTNHQK